MFYNIVLFYIILFEIMNNDNELLKINELENIKDIIEKNKNEINTEVVIETYINRNKKRDKHSFDYYKNILLILEEILKIINEEANSFVINGYYTEIQSNGDYMQKTREDTDRIFLLMNTFTDKFTDDYKLKIEEIIKNIKERLFKCCKIVEKGGKKQKTKNKKQKTKNKKQKTKNKKQKTKKNKEK